MYRNSAFEDVDAHSMTVIKHKARELVGHYGFTISNMEDVEQDLRIHVAQKLLEYDSMRGAKSTYVRTVIKRKITSIIKEERQSGRYDHRLIGRSLDEHVAADREDGLLLGDTLSWDSIRLGNSGLRRTSAEQSDMRIESDQRPRWILLAQLWPCRRLCLCH